MVVIGVEHVLGTLLLKDHDYLISNYTIYSIEHVEQFTRKLKKRKKGYFAGIRSLPASISLTLGSTYISFFGVSVLNSP